MVRALSPDSERIANDLLDLDHVLQCYSDQYIADNVNLYRTAEGQGALAELGAIASFRRKGAAPANPDPYSPDDVRQHRQNRASGSSMPSAPPASAPLPSSRRDVSGPPLSSGDPLDSHATGSSQPSMYSNYSASLPQRPAQPSRYQDSSLQDTSSDPSRTSDKGKARERAAPYPPSSQASGSSATSVKPVHCKHKPGGLAYPPEFVGCDLTDDELRQGGKKANNAKARVRMRMDAHKKAETLGVSTTGKAKQKYLEDRAARKGLPNRFALKQQELADCAAREGLPDRPALRKQYLDNRAARNGLPDRFALEKQDLDDRAARQLGSAATRHDLVKIQASERVLAAQLGVSVEEIRRRIRQPDPASPEPSFPGSNHRHRTPSPDADGGMTQRIRVGE